MADLTDMIVAKRAVQIAEADLEAAHLKDKQLEASLTAERSRADELAQQLRTAQCPWFRYAWVRDCPQESRPEGCDKCRALAKHQEARKG